MATDYTPDYPSLRSNTGHSEASLPNTACAPLYTRAEALYGEGSPIVYPATRELAILDLLGSAAKMHDYVQNNSREGAAQIFKNLQAMLDVWGKRRAEAEDEVAAAAMGGAAHFGRPTKKPARLAEYPDPSPPPYGVAWRDISRG